VINDLAFEGSEALVEQAEPMAARLAALKRRAVAAGVPTIYVNDNFGQWRSDFRQTVAHCTARSSPGRGVSSRRPAPDSEGLLRPEAETLRVFRHDPRHPARSAAHPTRHSHRYRRQYLRLVHGKRRLHA
jgi:hypothetical protein